MRLGLAWNGKSEKKYQDLAKRSQKHHKDVKDKSTKTEQKQCQKSSKIMIWAILGCSCGDLGRLGAMLAHLGVILGSSWDDLGHNFRSAWSQDGTKMDPSWCQDAPSWHLNGHLDATWGAILLILGILGAIFTKIAKVKNRTTVHQFCCIFDSWRVWLDALGHYFGRSWPQVRLSLATLASRWNIFGKMFA